MSKPDKIRLVEDGGWLRCGQSNVVNGVPRQMFRKAIMRAGVYVKGAADGKPWEATTRDLDHWATVFASMKANGVEVTIPNGHENADNARENLGFVREVFRDGDELIALAEMIGEDGIKAALRNNVSIYAPESWTDGKGNKYDWPIRHVALTPNPVVSGLGEFIPIAASEHYRGKQMESLKKLAAALDIPADKVTDEKTGIELVLSEITKLVAKSKATPEPKKDDPKPKADPKAVELSDPSPMLVRIAGENREMKVAKLLNEGKIDKATADQLRNDYVKPEALTLSMKAGTEGEFDRLYTVLEKNTPLRLGSQTGGQTIELADRLKSKDGNDLMEKDAERRAADAKARTVK